MKYRNRLSNKQIMRKMSEKMKLLRNHPRLMATNEDFERIRGLIQTDSDYADWWNIILKEADEIPSHGICYTFDLPDIRVFREVKKCIMILCIAYKVTSDKRYAEKAFRHIEALCIDGEGGFKDWYHEYHFLHTAEMATAISYGYDWLYNWLSDNQKNMIEASLIKYALIPAKATYEWYFDGKEKPDYKDKDFTRNGWVCCEHNWNFVCNSGIGIAALCIADTDPELSDYCLKAAMKSMRLCFKKALTDEGAWGEGIGYWSYAMAYLSEFTYSMENSVGKPDFVYDKSGMSDTWKFPVYLTGPTGQIFNFSDSGLYYKSGSEMLFLAKMFNNSDIADFRINILNKIYKTNITPYDLIWYRAEDRASDAEKNKIPTDVYYKDTEVVTMRSAWGDENALFVGIKAGDNKANHGDLDSGSFVLEALGVRWICDLGADNYALPHYWLDDPTGSKRWGYYRKAAQGHNTLMINPGNYPDQDPLSFTSFTDVKINCDEPEVACNLTSAYAHLGATGVTRSIKLSEGRTKVLLHDEIHCVKPTDVWSFLHTTHNIILSKDGRFAKLVCENKELHLKLCSSDESARFTVMNAEHVSGTYAVCHELEWDRSMFRKLAICFENQKSVTYDIEIQAYENTL